jgi:hypothetical protein
MGDGNNTHYIRVIEIDHRKGEALKNETTCTVQIGGPAPG